MKSTAFNLDIRGFIDNEDGNCECIIDLLPAYAINYTELKIWGTSYLENSDYWIDQPNSRVIIKDSSEKIKMAEDTHNTLIVNYFGIRDYRLLFPKVTNEKLAKRLGCFYEESEKTFDNNSWLAYSLMCAAVFEGILYSKYNRSDTFEKLIDCAYSKGDINDKIQSIMHGTRHIRNLVHANNYTDDYVNRKTAMDIRTVMDYIVKYFMK